MRRHQIFSFALIGLFLVAAATLGIESGRTLSKIQAALPSVPVELQRAMTTQFEALTRFERALDRFEAAPTASRLNDVNLALATVMAIDRQYGADFEALGSARVDAVRERLADMRREIRGWNAADQRQREAALPRVQAALGEIISGFEAALIDLNRRSVSSLRAERRNLATFQMWLWMMLGFVCLSAGGIAFALLWQGRTANRLREALQNIEISLSRALSSVNDGFALYGADGRLLFCNENYRELVGEAPDADLVGREHEDILRAAVARDHYPNALAEPEAWIAKRRGGFGREHSEQELELRGDRWCLAQSTRSPDGGTVHVLTEVTDLKRRENALKRSEERLEEAQAMARIGNWEFDMGSRQQWWSNELYRIFGIDPDMESLPEGSVIARIEEEDRDRVSRLMYDAMKRRGSVDLICGVLSGDGQHKQVELHARVESDPRTGRLINKGMVQDITEKQRAVETLRRTQAFLQTVTDHLPAQIAYLDTERRFQFINSAGASWYGSTPQDVIGRKLQDLVDDEEYGKRRPYIEAALAGRVIDDRAAFTYPDGVTRELDMHYVPDLGEGGKVRGCSVLLVDISEDLEREQLLHRAQKMEAVGQLTGGIAHDFNNILGVIIGNLQLLARQLTDEKALRRAASAEKAAARGAELTARLLAFSRRQVLQPQVIEVNSLVMGMDDMLRRTLGEDIEIETVLAAGLWRTRADPSQLENALLNMAVNARDAMPDGGKLTIETANTRLDESYVRDHPYVEAGQYVMLAVTDTGTGIPKELMAQVFEPFFTTKEQGKGTGLGLSMIYGFAKQSGGHVNIYSEVGLGTTLRIYLPRVEAELSAARRQRDGDEDAFPRGTETILIVEDNLALKETAHELLTSLGYTVLEAENGRQALDLISREPGVQLLLTDIVMPGGLSGIEVARQARLQLSDLKVILTSGYAHNGAVHRGLAEQTAHWISKPYDLASLAQMVREVLDG